MTAKRPRKPGPLLIRDVAINKDLRNKYDIQIRLVGDDMFVRRDNENSIIDAQQMRRWYDRVGLYLAWIEAKEK